MKADIFRVTGKTSVSLGDNWN